MPCTRHHSQYVYSASAYAISADFERPRKHTLPPQAASVLSAHGGHGTNRDPGQKVDGLVSYSNAYSEVGGSYDDCHDTYTTHAWSVVENVNIADMLTADRVVSRLAIYYPAHEKDEPSFDFTGSYFENLRIAGHPVNVKLDTQLLHEHDTFTKLSQAHKRGTSDPLLLGRALGDLGAGDLKKIEGTYHALSGMTGLVNKWKDRKKRGGEEYYRLSAANQIDFNAQVGPSEIEGYGSIICIPKFGVIRLAEIVVHRHSRSLVMFQVQMCSSGHGTGSGGGTGATGAP